MSIALLPFEGICLWCICGGSPIGVRFSEKRQGLGFSWCGLKPSYANAFGVGNQLA